MKSCLSSSLAAALVLSLYMGCAHAGDGASGTTSARIANARSTPTKLARADQRASSASSSSASPAKGTHAKRVAVAPSRDGAAGVVTSLRSRSRAARVDAKRRLRQAVAAELASKGLAGARVSVLVEDLGAAKTLVAHAPDVMRVPASNAKLLTTTAAALGLRGYHFVTEFSKRGSRVYVWGTGDPLLRGRELERIARTLKARGVRRVREVVVDASYFDRRRLAPGFRAFREGSYYRPTSGPLNVDGNAVIVRISAPKGRRRPRVDVVPPSDYVRVKKRLRFARRGRRCRSRRARRRCVRRRHGRCTRYARRPARRRRCRRSRRRARSRARISVRMRRRGSIMWLELRGSVPRGSGTRSMRRAVYDPALNVGWALRRALKKAGVRVAGIVRRGRRPRGARVLARKRRSLAAILRATNTHSDNLAAETLVRALGVRAGRGDAKDDARAKKVGEKRRARRRSARADTWARGLARARALLTKLGVRRFALKNGSGLHRSSKVSARAMVALLRAIYRKASLRRAIVPTLAVAGRSGTLARRMRAGAARGVVRAKTGTLGGVLALSGFAGLHGGKHKLAFSVLVNGRASRSARRAIDRIATHVAEYARGVTPAGPTSAPTSAPASAPTSRPSSSSKKPAPTKTAPIKAPAKAPAKAPKRGSRAVAAKASSANTKIAAKAKAPATAINASIAKAKAPATAAPPAKAKAPTAKAKAPTAKAKAPTAKAKAPTAKAKAPTAKAKAPRTTPIPVGPAPVTARRPTAKR